MYEAGKYSKAIRIFEQIAPIEVNQAENCFICSLNLLQNKTIYISWVSI
jgi:hypothetical protein